MTKVKVKIEGHYKVQDIPYRKIYRWVPAHALIECDCGQAMYELYARGYRSYYRR